MPVLPIDITAIVAVIMGISIVLVPVIGVTARFALKPLVQSMGHFFQSRTTEDTVRLLERRMGPARATHGNDGHGRPTTVRRRGVPQ